MSSLHVSIVIPCRNERAYIGPCLDSILANDYPRESLEIIVVDGMSDDGTREEIANYVARSSNLRLVDNIRRTTPCALNAGIAAARGAIIMRMDVHALYPEHYISRLIWWMEERNADNVGGVVITEPANESATARAIAAATSHPFGVGNSYFRIGVTEPRWVDTVPFGCYRRDVFDRIGPFDESLLRNQDDEFNLRLLKAGGRILLVPDVRIRYFARDRLSKVWRMHWQYGFFKPLVVKRVGGILTVRQVIPATLVVTLLFGLLIGPLVPVVGIMAAMVAAAYAVADAAASCQIALRRGAAVGMSAMVVFPVLHFSYGIGFVRGLVEFFLLDRAGDARLPETGPTR